MSILEILHRLILGPLELLFDVVYALAYQATRHPGISIIFLSLAINLLVLPLYRRADALQEEERQQALRMKPGVDHIKQAFKGDERFMILQTFYRQNNYKPYYALKGSLSLLLEIPFFIAAYRYLSSLRLLQGASFGPIADLGLPDGLIQIGGLTIHLLPVLMTAINIVSGAIYTRGMPLKSKIQLYGMALVFLVLLYDSPSGLVFYWTLNNLFSLVKNVFYKLKDPKKVIRWLCFACGLAAIAGAVAWLRSAGPRRALLLGAAGGALMLPLLWSLFRKKHLAKAAKREESPAAEKTGKTVFYACCVFLTVLLGVLIPSAVIKDSPGEFIDVRHFASPLWYVLSAFLLAAGTFGIWAVIFYRMSGKNGKRAFSLAFLAAAMVAVVNYMFFSKGYGNLNPTMIYDLPLTIAGRSYLLNTAVVLAVIALSVLVWKKKRELAKAVCIAGCMALAVMSIVNLVAIKTSSDEIAETNASVRTGKASFTLDKQGKNVVVLMMDRTISAYIPFLMEEQPELKRQFDGFTYYPNTLSYGTSTNVSTPSLYGGYDYIPDRIEERSDVSLKDKQNEALMIMPLNFLDEGYEVTVCDPPYANYQWIPDISIYDEYPEIRVYRTFNHFQQNEDEARDQTEATIRRNMFCYSVFRSVPILLQVDVYNNGAYNEADTMKIDPERQQQNYIPESPSKSTGIRNDFIADYNVLLNMNWMTRISDDGRDTFLMLSNTTTHNVMLLQEPEFEPRMVTDNTAYDEAHRVRTDANGRELRVETVAQAEHYECDMAALMLLGDWLDYLRENGVYDNTRIIIVSDHGRNLQQRSLILENFTGSDDVEEPYDIMCYNALLMVKDFGATGFTTDMTFMTCADTPVLAFEDTVRGAVNPFLEYTPITDEYKYEPEQHVMYSNAKIAENNGNVFADPVRMTLLNHYLFDEKNFIPTEAE